MRCAVGERWSVRGSRGLYVITFQRGGRTQETFLGLRSLPVRYPQLAGVYTSASCALLHRVERMTTASQLEASEAWRKAGFLVRPFHGHDEEDAKRFHQQILMALDGEMLSVSSGINYTMGDVARGDDTGGSNNPAVGAAATVATINRAHAVRAGLHWMKSLC